MPMLRTVRVIHDHTPLEFGRGATTIGETVDQRIREAVENGSTLQEVSVYFEEGEWQKFAGHYAPLGPKPSKRA